MQNIAHEKKGKALQVIKIINEGKILAAAIMDSLQNQSVVLLQSTDPGIKPLTQHADILFYLRDWENAALLYEKAMKMYHPPPADERMLAQRLDHCRQAIQKRRSMVMQ